MGFFQNPGNSIIWQQSQRYICIIYHKKSTIQGGHREDAAQIRRDRANCVQAQLLLLEARVDLERSRMAMEDYGTRMMLWRDAFLELDARRKLRNERERQKKRKRKAESSPSPSPPGKSSSSRPPRPPGSGDSGGGGAV